MILWAVQNAVVTLVLAIVVALLCHAARLGPASRHALWLVVLIKLMTPPMVVWPWALPILSHAGQTTASVGADSMRNASQGRPLSERLVSTEAGRDYVVSSEIVTIDASSVEIQSPMDGDAVTAIGESRFAASPKSLRPRMEWIWLVHIMWLAGALAMTALHVVRIFRMQRRDARATAAPEWLVREVADAAARLQIRPPRVVVAPGIASPLVWAFGRATLVWPRGLLAADEHQSWRGVIVHELAHVRRRDHWTGWLELAASCVWWFNPVFWYARCSLRENAELACDAWVVRTLPDGRRTYAEALLAVCEFDSQTVPPPLPALGVHSGTRRSFERRLTMILRERLPVRVSRGAWIAAALLAAVAVPNWYLIARAQPVSGDAATATDEGGSRPHHSDIPSVDLAPADDGPIAGPAPPDAAAPNLPDASEYNTLPSLSQELPTDVPSQGGQPPHSSPFRERRRGDADPRPGALGSPWGPNGPNGTSAPAPDQPTTLSTPPSGPDRAHVVESDSFTLTRTTYRVPPQVAETLKAFLEQNLSWPHLMRVESKEHSVERPSDIPGSSTAGPGALEAAPAVRESLLIVTASPTAQEVIGNLIGLMLESQSRAEAFDFHIGLQRN
jgi:beta-lactamase regulating signal transducer with metallopeptidase domain